MSLIQYTPPTLAELTADPEQAYRDDAFKAILNANPPEPWVKVNKYANNSRYLPIDKVELLLDRIYKKWRVEVKAQGHSFNGVWVSIRLHVFNPVTNEWDWNDGTGAEEIQVKAGSSPADLANINKGALSMAYPKAETEAIKDAAHKFGRIFGRDLNRKDLEGFAPSQTLLTRNQQRALTALESAKSVDELESVFSSVSHLGDFDDAYQVAKERLSKQIAPKAKRNPKASARRAK
jgi:hypothetical protein